MRVMLRLSHHKLTVVLHLFGCTAVRISKSFRYGAVIVEFVLPTGNVNLIVKGRGLKLKSKEVRIIHYYHC